MKPYATDPTNHWMNSTPSDWLDRYMPGWRQSGYGDLLRTTPADWLRWTQLPYAGGPGTQARHPFYTPQVHDPMHRRGCTCRDCRDRECRYCGCNPCRCRSESCECTCCIGDVDLVVYARVGEQRMIPILVENPRRRERAITVELSNWRLRGGGLAPVDTIEVEPKTFTLPPCGERHITIGVRIRAPEHAGVHEQPEGPVLERGKEDVDCCVVVTADLVLIGCDHRPIRIAIAILPRYCEPFRIDCGCCCC